ncbi:MAG TPA: hypothetical protein VK636_23235 [Gemmatimonadaceae bacterium]|nr:hypothetical protein [Gemmatimonadaceae bacterium]
MADRPNKQRDGNNDMSSDSLTDGPNRSGSDRSSSNIGSRPSTDRGFGASSSDSDSRGSKPDIPRKRRLDDEADPSDIDPEDSEEFGRP